MEKINRTDLEFEIVRPNPEEFLHSIRASGYTIETAICDIVDNSISAGAKDIYITFGIDSFTSFLRIEDNGTGMDESCLVNAMRIGSYNPLATRRPNDLGRFGLGLKTASFSQCKRLTVRSSKANSQCFTRCWDIDFVVQQGEWALLKSTFDPQSEMNLGLLSDESSGTIILWEKLDRLMDSSDLREQKEHFYRKFENVKKHLGLIFHRFLESDQINIYVQREKIAPVDPFHISLSVPTTELPQENFSINGNVIVIQPYILPHESKLSVDEKKNFELIRGWTDHQGIFLFRNGRLISDGSWLGLGFSIKENQRLCRIGIDIGNNLDLEWQIDVKKVSIIIPDAIRTRLKGICRSAIDKAVNVYTHRGAYLKRRTTATKVTYLWKVKTKQGKRYYEIDHAHPICQLIFSKLKGDSVLFTNLLKLIGELLPIGFIVNDFADSSIVMKDFFEDSNENINDILGCFFKSLIANGESEINAREIIKSLEIGRIQS